MKELKDGIRSLVRLDFRGHVHKQFRGTDSDKRFANEVEVLETLKERGAPNVPVLLESDEDTLTIVTTNCGAPAPLVTAAKATDLFDELEEKYGVRHDDPEPRNVTYSQQMGRFCLIDFELATILPCPDCKKTSTETFRGSWFGSSIQGKFHRANDDAFAMLSVLPDGTEKLPELGEVLLDPAHLVLAVSDGMGGQSAGEFASRLLMARIRREARRLYRELEKGEGQEKVLDRLLRDAHHDLIEISKGQKNVTGMGATLTMAWVTQERLFFAHIGDSRLYLVNEAGVQQLSKDDNRAWHQWQCGVIQEYAYRNHPYRSVLSDVLGGSKHEPSPQTGSVDLADWQRLMICSDGIMDGLWERNIVGMLTEGESNPRERANAMSGRARDNDGRDDTTIIIAEISRI